MSPSSSIRATRPQLPGTHCWSRGLTHKPHDTFTTTINTYTAAQFSHSWKTHILTDCSHRKDINTHARTPMCNRAHLLRDTAFGGPGEEAVPKMAGASSYCSQGADVCQGLTHSSLLCPPTSCCWGVANTLPQSKPNRLQTHKLRPPCKTNTLAYTQGNVSTHTDAHTQIHTNNLTHVSHINRRWPRGWLPVSQKGQVNEWGLRLYRLWTIADRVSEWLTMALQWD